MNKLYDREGELRTKEEQKRSHARTEQKLVGAFRRAFSTSDGKIALQHIAQMCGWHDSPVNLDPQSREINEKATVHDAIRQNVYRGIRRYIPHDILKVVEFDDLLRESDGAIKPAGEEPRKRVYNRGRKGSERSE